MRTRFAHASGKAGGASRIHVETGRPAEREGDQGGATGAVASAGLPKSGEKNGAAPANRRPISNAPSNDRRWTGKRLALVGIPLILLLTSSALVLPVLWQRPSGSQQDLCHPTPTSTSSCRTRRERRSSSSTSANTGKAATEVARSSRRKSPTRFRPGAVKTASTFCCWASMTGVIRPRLHAQIP